MNGGGGLLVAHRVLYVLYFFLSLFRTYCTVHAIPYITVLYYCIQYAIWNS